MKKKLLMFVLFMFSVCFISTKAFSQTAPGGSSSGTGDEDIEIDLGAAGVITIPTTSPYYAIVLQIVTTCHVTGQHVTAPCGHLSCYLTNLVQLFYVKCINSSTFNTAWSHPPSNCH